MINADNLGCMDYPRLVQDKFRKGTVLGAETIRIFAGEMRDCLDYVRLKKV